MALMDMKVPNIGDFKDVPIIEIMVKPGDEVKPDDPLLTLESDKAAMEVPAPAAGRVAEVLVGVGDKVSEGSAIVRLDTGIEQRMRTLNRKPAPAKAPAKRERSCRASREAGRERSDEAEPASSHKPSRFPGLDTAPAIFTRAPPCGASRASWTSI